MANLYLAIYSSAASDIAVQYKNTYWRNAYEGLFAEIIKLGCVPVLVYSQEDNYLGNGVFRCYWEASLDESGKIQFTHFDKKITLLFLFDKDRFNGTDLAVTDPIEVREVCQDKYLSYLFAPELHARSFLLEKEAQENALRLSWGEKKIALKELDGCGGEKVFVGEMAEYDGSLKFPLLAQEFIDTSVGVPGICDGMHDLRVVVYNGEIISLLLRRPPEGDYRSNMSCGGKYEELDIGQVPEDLRLMTTGLDKRFGIEKDRFYSIDFANTRDGWRIFELNAWPGLGYGTKNEKLFTKRLARCLVSSLARQNRFSSE